jgi:hypothetical protein
MVTCLQMHRARNTEISSKLEDILMHLDLWQQKGDHKTDAMLAESQIYLQDDVSNSLKFQPLFFYERWFHDRH